MYVRFAYSHIPSHNSFDSWLRLPKQKCGMPFKSLTITFSTTSLPALDPNSRPLSSPLLYRFTDILLQSGETTRK
jgi:hypothetical protein